MKEKITIREAQNKDFNWISDLMHNALESYYGGDHRAHAERIFKAHIDGGHDRVGFFSFEQRMFIVEINGIRAGMVHLVGKRQSTYKISPLIIIPEFQGKHGLGSRLLFYAEEYASKRNARQLYCTVAEKNLSAMQFFSRKGFIKAGSSDSHYKNWVTEAMFYKPLKSHSAGPSKLVQVSVLPFEEKHKEQVAKLLRDKLSFSFEGITDEWITALFEGHHRRHTADINSKYKMIFVALDRKGNVIGVAAATPKKGSPIKIMPLIATNQAAFEALLVDIPHQLVPHGHKLYIHINPTVSEVVSLQRFGWRLDAAMPSAYRAEIVTQQWSLEIKKETTMKTLRVKPRFFNLICSGKKDLEVRVGYESVNRIQTGEYIRLVTHQSTFDVRVHAIRKYPDFQTMLDKEIHKRIVPGSISSSEVLSLLKEIYPPAKEKLGIVVFEFKD